MSENEKIVNQIIDNIEKFIKEEFDEYAFNEDLYAILNKVIRRRM